jgi:hypothetical protein
MEETLERADAEGAGSSATTLDQPRRRWTQWHTIWLLMVLSLLPGVLIAFDRELWTTLPAGVRAATYLVSASLIAVACGLILRHGGSRDEA